MKKYLIFMLLLLVSVGASAVDVTTINLTFGDRTLNSGEWYYRDVTDASQIRVGDIILVSYDKVTSEYCQYAICDTQGKKIYTNGADQQYLCYDCPVGDTDFTFPVDDDLYKEIVTDNGGLQIQDKGLAGKMTIQIIRVGENWKQYKPTDSNCTEIMSIPQYIKDWYNDGYVLKTSTDYVGKTLRVVCLETADDSYAFLKKNDDKWSSLMSGSDKFSIAGWKYFEIKINKELNDLLKGKGLRIGGNNYYIAGIYVYGTDTTAPDWTSDDSDDSDVIDTYTFSNVLDGTANWDGARIPGNFFEYQGQGEQISTTKLANTKNNIIRFVFDGTASAGAQVSAKDADPSSTSSDNVLKDANDNYASYIRQRNYDTTNGSFYYVDYADCQGADHFDFELSDAITLFKDYNHPVVDNTDNAPGTKKGMLSTLLQNGMVIGANKVKITKVEIRKSMVSKYVSGYAEYNHPLSDKVWRPIALPYNLTQEQVKATFGENALVCELGPSSVSKTYVGKDGVSYSYGIALSFQKITDGINANYPYIIKLGNLDKAMYNYDESKGGYQGPFVINNVKADVRDFQAYEFRTPEFTMSDDFMKSEPKADEEDYTQKKNIWDFEQSIKNNIKGAYMVFQSTAPVFDITNTGVGEVEIINDVDQYTILKKPTNQATEPTNYFFYDGTLVPVLTKDRPLMSGLAYIKFPPETYNLFNSSSNHPSEVALAKMSYIFPDASNTTGIDEMVIPAKKQITNCIYSLGGQLIRNGNSCEGLPKGIYIINGKKVIVK